MTIDGASFSAVLDFFVLLGQVGGVNHVLSV